MATRQDNTAEWKARGNTMFLAGDFVGAAEAFRCAVDLLGQRKTTACQVGRFRKTQVSDVPSSSRWNWASTQQAK